MLCYFMKKAIRKVILTMYLQASFDAKQPIQIPKKTLELSSFLQLTCNSDTLLKLKVVRINIAIY